jgi:hypothetical protein
MPSNLIGKPAGGETMTGERLATMHACAECGESMEGMSELCPKCEKEQERQRLIFRRAFFPVNRFSAQDGAVPPGHTVLCGTPVCGCNHTPHRVEIRTGDTPEVIETDPEKGMKP